MIVSAFMVISCVYVPYVVPYQPPLLTIGLLRDSGVFLIDLNPKVPIYSSWTLASDP